MLARTTFFLATVAGLVAAAITEAPTYGVYYGRDSAGGALDSGEVTYPSSEYGCQARCNADSRCFGYTYGVTNHACYIKGAVNCDAKNLYVPNSDYNSGVKGGCEVTCNGVTGLYQLSCKNVVSIEPTIKPVKRSSKVLGLCPTGLDACPLSNSSSGGYECIDLQEELESCGSCGNDCGIIRGAKDVACISGKCVVQSCGSKFVLADGTCFRSSQSRRNANLL